MYDIVFGAMVFIVLSPHQLYFLTTATLCIRRSLQTILSSHTYILYMRERNRFPEKFQAIFTRIDFTPREIHFPGKF